MTVVESCIRQGLTSLLIGYKILGYGLFIIDNKTPKVSNKIIQKKVPKTSQKAPSKKRRVFQKARIELLAPAGLSAKALGNKVEEHNSRKNKGNRKNRTELLAPAGVPAKASKTKAENRGIGKAKGNIRNRIELLAPAGLSAKASKTKVEIRGIRKTKGNTRNRIELLAPAGSMEKLQYALHYGADAVYLGIPGFSLRYRVNDFDEKGLERAVLYVHSKNKRIYVTANIYAHNVHIDGLVKHFKKLNKLDIDGIIVSDPGVLALAAKYAPKIPIHLSTQANTTNLVAAQFWAKQGVKRIILAREVTLEEIRDIKRKLGKKTELEYFVHGAMCMSYSGRCILSKWMTGRSANLGDCAQPCRWKYSISDKGQGTSDKDVLAMTVTDDKGEHEVDVEEDEQGTYFFNSKDLNLLGHLGELKDAGVESFKIEGRNKSVYYLSVVVKAYRKVLDAVETGDAKLLKKVYKEQQKELEDLVHRGYTTGFLLGNEPEHDFEASHKTSRYEFVGQVVGCDKDVIEVKPHNAIRMDDKLEIISEDKTLKVKLKEIRNEKGAVCESAHGGQGKNYFLKVNKKGIEPMSLVRRVI